jgi:hypothetical protein
MSEKGCKYKAIPNIKPLKLKQKALQHSKCCRAYMSQN